MRVVVVVLRQGTSKMVVVVRRFALFAVKEVGGEIRAVCLGGGGGR